MFADNLERTLIDEMRYSTFTHAAYMKHLKEIMIKLSNSLMISSVEDFKLSGAADGEYKQQISNLIYIRMKAEQFHSAVMENQITYRYKAEMHLKFISTVTQLNLVYTQHL